MEEWQRRDLVKPHRRDHLLKKWQLERRTEALVADCRELMLRDCAAHGMPVVWDDDLDDGGDS